MAKKQRKPTVDDAYDAKRRRNDPGPESRDLSHDEAVLFDAARKAAADLVRTFELWVVIGRAVVAARTRADRIGGGKTFRRILEQQGLARIVPPSTATLLVMIIERLPEVEAVRAGWTEAQRIKWASPTAVIKHCPGVFPKGNKANAKPRLPRIGFETAFDAVLDHLHGMDDDNRRVNIERILSPFGLAVAQRVAKPVGKKEKARAGLEWKVTGQWDDRDSFRAPVAGGYYEVAPARSGSSRHHYRATHFIGRKQRRVGHLDIKTADEAKTLCERDHEQGDAAAATRKATQPILMRL